MLLKVNKSCRGQTKPCRGKTYSCTNPHITGKLFSASLSDAFVVALEVLVSVLKVTKPLSVRLQRATKDIYNMSESVRNCITTLQGMRTNKYLKKICKNAEQQHGAAVEMPRINARQRNRENHPVDSAKEYYRRSMYFPYLDVCLEQLRERPTAHPATVYGLSSLLPAYVIDADISNLRAAAKAYECFLPEGAEWFEAELVRWKAYWARQPSDCRPGNVLNHGLLNSSICTGNKIRAVTKMWLML